jgi:glucan biosynthesis protein C
MALWSADRLPDGPQRLYFVQWLRVFLVSLVVAHHAGQPYGPTGGEWPIRDPTSSPVLGVFFALNAAYFMGFFFLIAGYFSPGSCDRKGTAAFARDRVVRLGIPLAVFTFTVFALVAFSSQDATSNFIDFYMRDYIGRWQIEMGHLWFIAQLLAMSLIYALVRWWHTRSGGAEERTVPLPSDRTILLYAVTLGVVGALVRIWYPQDVWVRLAWLIPAEPAHLPQYASLFAIGLIAGRGGWFTGIAERTGLRWFAIGIAAFVAGVLLLWRPGLVPPGVGRSVVWGLLEAFVCVGMILGLLVIFRRYLSRPGRLLALLEGNVYGVYIIHVFVVVPLQGALLGFELPALVKFAIVTLLALPLCFAIIGALRQVPAIRRVV